MKKSIVLMVLLLNLVGCGNNSRIEITQSNARRISLENKRIDELSAKLDELALQNLKDKALMFDLLDEYRRSVNLSNSVVSGLQADIEILRTTLLNNEADLVDLQGIITDQALEIAEQTSVIIDIIDPCGDGSGNDQVLFKTNEGKFITFIDKDGVKSMTQLNNGVYETQDAQKCNYTISSTGIAF